VTKGLQPRETAEHNKVTVMLLTNTRRFMTKPVTNAYDYFYSQILPQSLLRQPRSTELNKAATEHL
jgi:hypothetical protein